MSTYYVAGLLFADVRSKVMLIRKSHPDWMKGKLNGIGGHIEDSDKSPDDAMRREFNEETGLNVVNWQKFAVLVGDEETDKPWWVHWYTAAVLHSADYMPVTPFNGVVIPPELDEPVNWYDVESLMRGLHGSMMYNIRWLIHMAIEHVEGCNRVNRYHITEKYSTEYADNET